MNRLDQADRLYRESPALALEWPEGLVKKLERASRQRTPRNIKLTEEEITILSEHLNAPRGWLNHRNIQIVLGDGVIFRLC